MAHCANYQHIFKVVQHWSSSRHQHLSAGGRRKPDRLAHVCKPRRRKVGRKSWRRRRTDRLCQRRRCHSPGCRTVNREIDSETGNFEVGEQHNVALRGAECGVHQEARGDEWATNPALKSESPKGSCPPQVFTLDMFLGRRPLCKCGKANRRCQIYSSAL